VWNRTAECVLSILILELSMCSLLLLFSAGCFMLNNKGRKSLERK
jgi:hypothetical protein